MKFLTHVALAALLALSSLGMSAQELPKPMTTGGMPLMEAISARHSSRDINAGSQVTQQDLSNMLWAAWGITHDGGKRAVATAMNRQELQLYVITKAGVSRYSAETNSLIPVVSADLTSLLGRPGFATEAPVSIAIVGDSKKQDKAEFQHYAAGAASQDIYLYCTQAGLKTVVRAGLDRDALAQAMKLPQGQKVLYVQTVGK